MFSINFRRADDLNFLLNFSDGLFVLTGIIYWHEFFVKEIDLSKGTLTVYERNKENEKGMNKKTKTVSEILEKTLCVKYVYENCLPFEKSVDIAEALIARRDREYSLFFKNCEHTVRFLKTGKKESKQVPGKILNLFESLLGPLPGKVLWPIITALAELCGDSVVNKVAPISDFLGFGAEVSTATLVVAISYFFNVMRLKSKLDKGKISEDNFKDLRTILRGRLGGLFAGSILGVLIVAILAWMGTSCVPTLVVTLILSVVLGHFGQFFGEWWANEKVRERNEERYYAASKDAKRQTNQKFKQILIFQIKREAENSVRRMKCWKRCRF